MKVYSQEFASLIHQLHKSRKKTVLVTGVFDLLHAEHVNFLLQAKKEGDVLLVGVESDARVKKIKGENRPVWHQQKRVDEIKKTQIADLVFVLPEKFDKPVEHLKLLRYLRPQILAISSHSPNQPQKEKLIRKVGGELMIVLQHNPDVSTTNKVATLQKTPVRKQEF